jgi:hypothetical protein
VEPCADERALHIDDHFGRHRFRQVKLARVAFVVIVHIGQTAFDDLSDDMLSRVRCDQSVARDDDRSSSATWPGNLRRREEKLRTKEKCKNRPVCECLTISLVAGG